MQITSHRTRIAVAPVVLAVLALIVAACGSSSSSSSTSNTQSTTTSGSTQTTSSDTSLAAMVPAPLKERGKLSIATIDFPPAAYEDEESKELTGWEVEMGREIGKALGLETEFHVIEFASVLPGLQAKKYDMAMGDILIDEEREEIVDMVSNHEAYEAFGALSSSTLKISGWLDVCGKKIALLIGGQEAKDAQAAQSECKEAGKPQIEIQQYQAQPQVNLALESGRAELMATDVDSLSYVISQTSDKFKLVGRYGPSALTGIAIPKSEYSLELAKAVQAAIHQLIKEGTYQHIFQEFNQGNGAIPASLVQVNPKKTVFEKGE